MKKILIGLLLIFTNQAFAFTQNDAMGVAGDVFADSLRKMQSTSGSDIDPASILGIDPEMTDPNSALSYGSALSSAAGGGVGNFELKRSASHETTCVENEKFIIGGLEVRVDSCLDEENQNIVVAVCDLALRGLSCDEEQYSTPQQISASATIFDGRPLEYLHSLKVKCDDDNKCLYELESIIKETGVGCKHFPGAALDCAADTGIVSNQRYGAMENHPLSIANAMASGSDLEGDLLNQIKAMEDDIADCDEWRLETFLETGEMPETCDKSDPRRHSFPELLDKDNQFCEGGITTGQCSVDLPTQIVSCKDRDEQECSFERPLQNEVCHEDLNVSPQYGNEKTETGAVSIKVENIQNGSRHLTSTALEINFEKNEYRIHLITQGGSSGRTSVSSWVRNGRKVQLENPFWIPGNPMMFPSFGFTATWSTPSKEMMDMACRLNGKFTVDGNAVNCATKTVKTGGYTRSGNRYSHTFQLNWSITTSEIIFNEHLSNNCAVFWDAEPNNWDDGTDDDYHIVDDDSLYECFQLGERVCVDSENPKIFEVNGVPVEATKSCWKWKYDYACYGAVESSCNIKDLTNNGWQSAGDVPGSSQWPRGGTEDDLPVFWKEIFEKPGTCDGSKDFGCKFISEQNGTEKYQCYTGDMPTCYPEDEQQSCSVTSYSCLAYENGLCTKQSHTYTCSVANTCVSDWDFNENYPVPESNFAAAIMAMQSVEEIATHIEIDENGEISFFGGEPAVCRAVTAGARDRMATVAGAIAVVSAIFPPAGGIMAAVEMWGLVPNGGGGGNYTPSDLIKLADRKYSNCCATNPEDIHTSGKYCTDQDVELAAARMGARTVYLGKRDTDNSFCWDSTTPTYLSPPTGALFAGGHGGNFFGVKICNGKLSGIKIADAAIGYAAPYGIGAASKKIQFDTEEDFCKFDSELSRIIQEQGREQLAQLAGKNVAGAVTQKISFGFYANQGFGWRENITINGNRIHFWQWNAQCENEQYRAESLFEDQDCAFSTDVFVAVCEKDNCGALPAYPHPNYDNGDWSVFSLEGENHALKALTRYVVLEGGCFDDGSCDYELSGWPAGQGGELRINADIEWRLRSINNSDAEAMANPWGQVNYSTNQLHYQAYSYPLIPVEGEEEPRPRIRYCSEQLRYDYNSSSGTYTDKCEGRWQEISMPSEAINSPGIEVITMPKTHLMGGCDAHGLCSYRASTGITVTAKPWIKPSSNVRSIKYGKKLRFPRIKNRSKNVVYNRKNNPQCHGFTMDEFMALDLSRMDFSDYISRLSDEAKAEFYQMMGGLSQ